MSRHCGVVSWLIEINVLLISSRKDLGVHKWPVKEKSTSSRFFYSANEFACDEHDFIGQSEIFQGLVILGADQKDGSL